MAEIELACVAGVEGEGKGKKRAPEVALSLPFYGLPRRLSSNIYTKHDRGKCQLLFTHSKLRVSLWL